jgi:hypothetical protein
MSEAPKAPAADAHDKHDKKDKKDKGHAPDKAHGHEKTADVAAHAVDAHAHDTHHDVHALVGAQMATSLPLGSYTLGALRDAPVKRGLKGLAKVGVAGGLLVMAPTATVTGLVGYKVGKQLFKLPGLRTIRDAGLSLWRRGKEGLLGKSPEHHPDERSLIQKGADAVDDMSALTVVTPLKIAYGVPRDAVHAGRWAVDKTFGNLLRGLRGLTVKDKSDHSSVAHDVGIAARTVVVDGYKMVKYLVQQPFKHPYSVGIPLAAFTAIAINTGGVGPALELLASKGGELTTFLGKLGAKILAKF